MHLLTAIALVVVLTAACCILTIWQRPKLPADRDENKEFKIEAHIRRQTIRENMLATEIHKLERELKKKAIALEQFKNYRRLSSPRNLQVNHDKSLNLNIPEVEEDTANPEEYATPTPIPKFYKFLIRRKSHSTIPESVNESWSHVSSPKSSRARPAREVDYENGARFAIAELSLGY